MNPVRSKKSEISADSQNVNRTSNGMKQWQSFLVVGVMIISIGMLGTSYDVYISKGVWNRFHVFPAVAMFFNSDDAELASDIGSRSFNTFGRYSYDLEKAQKYLERALVIDPMAPTAWHDLARIDFLNGNFSSALVKIDRQIELHSDLMPAYYVRGLIYAYSNNFDKAEQDFLTFLAWKKESWAANNDLSWVYFRQGKYEQSLEYAEKGLVSAPNNPWLLTMQGVSLINLREKGEAVGVLDHALIEANKLTKEDWIKAYPGNDPAEAERGLAEMIKTIETNLTLVD